MEKFILTTGKELDQLIAKSIRKELDAKSKNQVPVLEILTLEEASQFLNIAKQTIYGFTSKRLIPHFKRGKKLYFKKSELESWILESKKVTAKEIEKGGFWS
jgi:excisionase family DNA binding protein